MFQAVAPMASTQAITEADQRGIIAARQRAAQEAETQLRQETESFVAEVHHHPPRPNRSTLQRDAGQHRQFGNRGAPKDA